MSKNPLYVVKKDHVEEAKDYVDYLLKKLNLNGALEFLESLFLILIEQVKSYPTFVVVKEFIDFIVSKLEMFRKVSII